MSRDAKIAVGVVGAVFVGVAGLALVALVQFKLEDHGVMKVEPAAEAGPAPTSPVVRAAPRSPKTLAEAISMYGAGDSENGFHPSVPAISAWASANATADDVVGETNVKATLGEALRDADVVRGRRVCIRGLVAEIYGETVNGARLYMGGIVDDDDHVGRFVAVGDVAGVEAGKRAQFCGLVVGRESFESSLHVRVQAVRLVGMFVTDVNLKRRRVGAPGSSATATRP
jgi:hypothetical protein